MPNKPFSYYTKRYPEIEKMFKAFEDSFPSRAEMYKAIFRYGHATLPAIDRFRIIDIFCTPADIDDRDSEDKKFVSIKFSIIISDDGSRDGMKALYIEFLFSSDDVIKFNHPKLIVRRLVSGLYFDGVYNDEEWERCDRFLPITDNQDRLWMR